MSAYKPPTPITLKTIGPRGRVLLLKALQGAINAGTPGERWTCLRLHEKGLLDRGRTSRDYWITAKGEDVANG